MRPPLLPACLAVALGGALGGATRWAAFDVWPTAPGFPTSLVVVNVVGTLLLAGLPLVGVVRRTPLLALALGPGVMGGFTTLSTASESTRALLADGHAGQAAAAVALTLAAALLGAELVSRRVRRLEAAHASAQEPGRAEPAP